MNFGIFSSTLHILNEVYTTIINYLYVMPKKERDEISKERKVATIIIYIFYSLYLQQEVVGSTPRFITNRITLQKT